MASRHVKCNIIIRELEVVVKGGAKKIYSRDDRETFGPVSCSFRQCPIKGQNNEADKQDGGNDKTEDRFVSRKNI